MPSPVNIPDFVQITGSTWDNSETKAIVQFEIDAGCGALGPGCVDYTAIVEPLAEFPQANDCPVMAIRIPRPLYDIDIPGTPHRDDLITIVINDPCDGIIDPGPAPAADPAPAPDPAPAAG